MGDLELRLWTESAWLDSAAACNELLRASDADPLFLSWDWLTLWWRHFGGDHAGRLRMLAAYRGQQLVGLAPFYLCHEVRQKLFAVKSIQLVGWRWRDPDVLLSEYLDVISPARERAGVIDAVLKHLAGDREWSECVIGMAPSSRGWAEALQRLAGMRGGYRREMDGSTAWQADLSQGFEAYLERLSGSARRSLWNQRNRLGQRGAVKLERIGGGDVAAGFDDLNRLHAQRWGGPAFSGRRLRFHLDLAQRLEPQDQLRLSRLMVGDRLVCVLYDLKAADRQYNIQMGFDSAFDRGASIGLLHLGYALEAACAEGVKTYDFLAGPGRSTDYKRALSQHSRQLSCVQLSTHPLLSRLYRWHDGRERAIASAGSPRDRG